MKSIINKFNPVFFLLVSVVLISCTSKTPEVNKDSQKVTTQRDTLIEDSKKKRENWEASLKAMNVQQLTEQLSKESETGLEPFNSMALKELISRGKNNTDEVIKNIKIYNRTSVLNLLAVRKLDESKFRSISDSVKAGVLLDALKNSKTYNSFGMPHVKWEDAALAILESGDAVKKGLYSLLSDKKPAPVWGSDDYNEYKIYQYRVCDYAYALLVSKNKETLNLSSKPEERDRLIEELNQKNK